MEEIYMLCNRNPLTGKETLSVVGRKKTISVFLAGRLGEPGFSMDCFRVYRRDGEDWIDITLQVRTGAF